MDTIQIIILAAGQGKRMQTEVPKALVPFHGMPMIDYVLRAVRESGLSRKPIVVVGYKKEEVVKHVAGQGICVDQKEILGTGHAVLATENDIPQDVSDIVVLYADAPSVTGAMVANLVATHTAENKNLTMATVVVPHFEGWYEVFYAPFSRVVRDEFGKIVKNVEFKDATEEEKKIRELNPCYFCFKKDWLFEHLKLIKNENTQGEYYLTDLVKYAATEGSIASVTISPEEALGVNSKVELERLEAIVKK